MSSVLAKYAKIAVADNKLEAYDLAMRSLSEDADAVDKICAVQKERVQSAELPAVKLIQKKRIVREEPIPSTPLRLHVVERARAIYGRGKLDKQNTPIQPTVSKQPSKDKILERHISMDRIDIGNFGVTAEMKHCHK